MQKNIALSIMAALLLVAIIFCSSPSAYAADVDIYAVKPNITKSIGLQGRYIVGATCYDESGFNIIDTYGKKWVINEKLNFNEHVVLIVRSNYTVDDDSDDWIEDILRSNPAEMSVD